MGHYLLIFLFLLLMINFLSKPATTETTLIIVRVKISRYHQKQRIPKYKIISTVPLPSSNRPYICLKKSVITFFPLRLYTMPENNEPEFRYMNEWVNQNQKMKKLSFQPCRRVTLFRNLEILSAMNAISGIKSAIIKQITKKTGTGNVNTIKNQSIKKSIILI
ncbi:hypothetical protein ABGY98_003103 [Salmonella enterica]|uniref:hypothetical protein n=1 Tax=Salmonella enterica TaxID=28901 RepID=UPI0013615120|nr:hypothetical protein [Salmonella enterica]EBV5863093.1 hypothetical protein [Salmonella enterica subsp. enterica serovar Bere]MCH5483316.1 hypothetical protein [Salmonella enterica subsp. diarizonae serovar 16:z10:e,n,x,z15]EGR6192584.1 hypothetical protein [Salmonella enterica]EHM9004781.1 hypothetical protein [Salmonella enterica]